MTTSTDVVVKALTDAGFSVGDGISRTGTTELSTPYVVVYPIFATFTGTLKDPNADVTRRVQLNCVAESRWRAEDLAEKTAVVMRSGLANPTGLTYAGPVLHEFSNGVHRDDAVNPPLFVAVDQFYLPLTPP